MHRGILTVILFYALGKYGGQASTECGNCGSSKTETGNNSDCITSSHASNISIDASSSLSPLLSERGYCLAGDYDILVSRHPLFNMSITDASRCVSYIGPGRTQRFVSPPWNFQSYVYYPPPSQSRGTLEFKVMNTFPSVWDAYMQFRNDSSIMINSTARYEDLSVELTNIGSGKEPIFQIYYKRFQRALFDKRVPFYHLRAQIVHGEFEMKKSVFGDSDGLHFSTQFLDYVNENLIPMVDNETSLWNDRFFLLFGTHYVQKGRFGGYIDLMVSPWDTVCELPTSINLTAFAKCTSAKLNRKFGLGEEKKGPLNGNKEVEEACEAFSFWVLNDQDVLSVVSGGDYDLQVAMSIGVRYPQYRDDIDKPLMRGWLRSIYDTPGLVDGALEPICELFPEGKLKESCKWNLLRYLRSNEPLLRTQFDDDQNERCPHAATLVAFDSGFNILRNGCISTTKSNVLCPNQRWYTDGTTEVTSEAAAHCTKLQSLLILAFAVFHFFKGDLVVRDMR